MPPFRFKGWHRPGLTFGYDFQSAGSTSVRRSHARLAGPCASAPSSHDAPGPTRLASPHGPARPLLTLTSPRQRTPLGGHVGGGEAPPPSVPVGSACGLSVAAGSKAVLSALIAGPPPEARTAALRPRYDLAPLGRIK